MISTVPNSRSWHLLCAGVLFAVLAGSCSDTGPGEAEVLGAQASRIGADDSSFSISVNEVPDNPLVAELIVTSAVAVTAEVTIRPVEPGPPDRTLAGWDADSSLRLPIVGMRADRDYTLSVQLVTTDGVLYGEPEKFEFSTGSLPDDLPEMTTESDPEASSPGDTLFNLIDLRNLLDRSEAGKVDMGHLLIVDPDGEVIWYFRERRMVGDARQLANGNLLLELGDVTAAEVNLFGEIVNEWAGRFGRSGAETLIGESAARNVASADAVSVDIDSMHHEHAVLPSGNHLTLTSELRSVSGFDAPRCGEDPSSFDGSYELAGDSIVEFHPETGDVVRKFSLFDYIDPLAEFAENDTCTPVPWVFPNSLYGPIIAPDVRDWTHANAAVLDSERNALIVSVRHHDALLAIRYADDEQGASGDLLWRLGPGGDIEMDDADHAYHPHAPEVQADGSYLVYDNGNFRPGGRRFSRVLLYDVDDESKSATVEWEYRSRVDGQPAYAGFVGDADRLANGSVLIVDGGLLLGVNGVFSQITEVDPRGDSGGEVAFNLRVVTQGFGIYRAERLETLASSGVAASPANS